MDNSSLSSTSVSEEKSSETIRNSSTSLEDHNSMDKLSAWLSGTPQINGVHGMNNTSDAQKRIGQGYNYKEDEEGDEEEEEEEDDFSEEALLAQMGYAESEAKREMIKELEKQYYDEDGGEEEDDLSEESLPVQMGLGKNEPPKHEQITTAMAALNLVSAFKGSRVKGGKPAKECRVSWAPDVDDHFAPSKTESHKTEQKVRNAAGKNRQKDRGKGAGASEGGGGGGKGSRNGGGKSSVAGGGKAAGNGKDKKQVKKYGRSASKYSNYDE